MELIDIAVKDILANIETACAILAEEAVQGKEGAEFKPLSSFQETADGLYNWPELLKDLISSKLEYFIECEGLQREEILDRLYQVEHDALRIAVLRLRGDENLYGVAVGRSLDTTDMDLVRKSCRVKAVGKKKRKREYLFGQPVVRILRWMGAKGFTFKQAKEACHRLFKKKPKDSTIEINLYLGRRGKADTPVLTQEQADELERSSEETQTVD